MKHCRRQLATAIRPKPGETSQRGERKGGTDWYVRLKGEGLSRACPCPSLLMVVSIYRSAFDFNFNRPVLALAASAEGASRLRCTER